MTMLVRAAALAFVFGACRTVPARDACPVPEGSLPAGADAAALAGEFRLRLVSSGQDGMARDVAGSLTLHATPDSLRYAAAIGGGIDSTVMHPVWGSADLDLGAVGAATAGDLRSTAPHAPGALAVQWPMDATTSPRQIIIRLGAEGNRRGSTPIDAAYTVLRVLRIDASGFGGRWESGSEGRVTSGHFCAERRAP